MRFDCVTIIGVGLIGGSLGLEIRRKKLAHRVIGCGRNLGNLRIAKKRGLVDEVTRDVAGAVARADLVILCTPVATTHAILKIISQKAGPGTLVIDCGSTKVDVTAWAEKILPKDISFVGCHPMAGTEKSGAAAALPDLFKKKLCLVTPSRLSTKKTVEKVKSFWKKIGSRVEVMTPPKHDGLVGLVSHLPQMASSALFSALTCELSLKDIQHYAGGGLKDTTRIAASPPEMWRDIALTNRKNLSHLLSQFEKELAGLRKLVEEGRSRDLQTYLTRVSDMRKRLV